MNDIRGIVFKDKSTKKLVQKIKNECIAVIEHPAIDVVAAEDLKLRGIRAIVNCTTTLTDGCCLDGVKYLLDNDISIFDIDYSFFNAVNDFDIISIRNNYIFINGIKFGECRSIRKDDLLSVSIKNNVYIKNKNEFMKNTFLYMEKELDYFLNDRDFCDIGLDIKNREVLIVSRGRNYRKDLESVVGFIKKRKPLLIGVDGGADALLELGFKSHIIIGDMDSVSNKSLESCCKVLVHAYENGIAPGLKRIEDLGLKYQLFTLKGTSEDAAIYLSKIKGASMIYLIGGHLCIDEFLEKGRAGMSSTLLLRTLFGSNIIDLKGYCNIKECNRVNYTKASVLLLISVLMLIVSFLSGSGLLNIMQGAIKALLNNV